MRVLISWHGAVEQAYRGLFHELSAYGINVRVIIPSRWIEGGRLISCQSDDLDNYDIYVYRTFFTNHIRAFFYPNIIRLAKEILTFKPDIIHIMEEPFSVAATQFLLAKQFMKYTAKAVLYSAENIDFTQRFPYSIFQRFNLSRTDALTVVPKEGMQLWEKRGFKGKIYSIPLGIDTELFQKTLPVDLPEPLSGITLKDNVFRIGYAGRIVEEKGIDLLIEAVSGLQKMKKNCELYIVGSGNYKDCLMQLIKRWGLKTRIKFISALTQEDLPAFYSLMDVLVLPSLTTSGWKEQFGRVIVEAMACETPVIGSSSGEIPNVIGDAGMVFPEGDAKALVDCIGRLIEDETLRKELSIEGKNRVMQFYSWKAVAKQYIDMYKEIMGKNKRSIN